MGLLASKKYLRGRIGEKHTTNEGYFVEIVDCGSKRNYCTIKFCDPVEYTIEVSYGNLKKGQVKNLYNRRVSGVGYVG